ncbi:MAG TPA: hypothetical protein VF733_04815 [Candidatus Saccharimonadales bacterium]
MSADNHNVALSPWGDPEYASPSELSHLQTQAEQIWSMARRVYPDMNLGELTVRADEFCATFEYQPGGPAVRNKLAIYYDTDEVMWLTTDTYSPSLEDEGLHAVTHSIVASPLASGRPSLITLEAGLLSQDGFVLRDLEYAEHESDPLTHGQAMNFLKSFEQLQEILSPDKLPAPRQTSPQRVSLWSGMILGK